MTLGPTPEGAKSVQALLLRAKELEAVEPIVSYFCKLHAVQQILGTKLHLEDPEVASFAGELLDDIETSKQENSTLASEQGQAILQDDTIANAYIDGFALKVFAKADKDVYSKTSSKATANGFMAAAVFYDLLKLFQPQLDGEISQKIKYSKFQAARILRAYREGKDPNDYEPPTPKVDQEGEEEEAVELDATPSDTSIEQPPAVDNDDIEVLPISPDPPKPPTARSPPPVQPSSLPSAPFTPPVASVHHVPTIQTPPVAPSYPAPAEAPAAAAAPPSHVYTRNDAQKIMDRSTVISQAQKHAKFAISALNYEDITTALTELSTALDQLKAIEDQQL